MSSVDKNINVRAKNARSRISSSLRGSYGEVEYPVIRRLMPEAGKMEKMFDTSVEQYSTGVSTFPIFAKSMCAGPEKHCKHLKFNAAIWHFL